MCLEYQFYCLFTGTMGETTAKRHKHDTTTRHAGLSQSSRSSSFYRATDARKFAYATNSSGKFSELRDQFFFLNCSLWTGHVFFQLSSTKDTYERVLSQAVSRYPFYSNISWLACGDGIRRLTSMGEWFYSVIYRSVVLLTSNKTSLSNIVLRD